MIAETLGAWILPRRFARRYVSAVSLRYLLSRRIAYISVIAITFGVMAMIVVTSVMDGFQDNIRKNIRNVDAALTVSADADLLNPEASYESVMARLKPFLAENGGPIVAASKRVTVFAHVITTAQGPKSYDDRAREWGIQLIGIDPKLESQVLPWNELLDRVQDPLSAVPNDPKTREQPFTYIDPTSGLPAAQPGILLGSWLARRLRVGRGDLVTVNTGKISRKPNGEPEIEGASERFIVVGSFESGRFDYDDHLAFCRGKTLQRILALSSDCSTVHLKLADPEKSEIVKEEIMAKVPGISVTSWRDRLRSFAEALDVEKAVMLIICFFIVMVASASICGILYMLVIEKTRDIGILLAMGATRGGIVHIFILYGGFLGILGSGLGTFLGLEVVWHINQIKDFLDHSLGIQLFPPTVYQFREIPTLVDSKQIVRLVIGSLSVSFIASALPALRAARLDPVKCLSYE